MPSGSIVTSFPQLSGDDEVWFDPTTNRWFVAAGTKPGGPVIGVIDAATNTLLQSIPTFGNAHSVSVDPISGEVFVPEVPDASNADCLNGCIAVFSTAAVAAPEPGSVILMTLGVMVIGGLGLRRRQR
jgi:hypothetical protein